MSDELTSAEAREWLKDLQKDIKKQRNMLQELLDVEEWLLSIIETRKKITLEDVRDWFHDCTTLGNSPATLEEVALGLGVSSSQLRNKGFIPKLVEQGTIILCLSDLDNKHRWRFDAKSYDELKAYPNRYKRGPNLRLVANRAEPGTSGKPRRARKTSIRRHRKGHR